MLGAEARHGRVALTVVEREEVLRLPAEQLADEAREQGVPHDDVTFLTALAHVLEPQARAAERDVLLAQRREAE